MLILLEGADGTGKTSLASALCAQYGFDYLHFGVPDKHPMDYWFETLVNIKKPTVIDRLHLSEDAYGPVFRGESQLSDRDRWLIEGWLWARKCALIVCSTSWDNMQENQERVKGEYHGDRQKAVVERYQELILETSLPCVIYDYTYHKGEVPTGFTHFSNDGRNFKPHERSLIDIMKHLGEVDWDDPGMGTLKPDAWLVGEQRNLRGELEPRDLQTVFQGTSGDYLRQTLDLASLRWHQIHLSNALPNDGDKPYSLYVKWRDLGSPRTVALGRVASQMLETFEVPHTKVSHPQYWRRFHYHSMKEYADAISNASMR